MSDLKAMPWDDLIREFYTVPTIRRPAETDALREEIRRRVDAVRHSPRKAAP